jgi:hypothetical protein
MQLNIESHSLLDTIAALGSVYSSSIAPNLCTASGDGLARVMQGKPASFTVVVKDSQVKEQTVETTYKFEG